MDIFYYPRLLFYKYGSVDINSFEYALLKGDKQLVQSILDNPKFDVHQATLYTEWYANSRFDVTEKDFYPIHFAAICGNAAAIKALIDRNANLEQKDVHKMTPLHCAALNVNPQTAQALIDAGANIEAKANFKPKNDGSRLPPYMTFKCNTNAVEYLKKANLEGKPFTPLAVAACAGNVEVMKVLIKAGANLSDFSVLSAGIKSSEVAILINNLHAIENIVRRMVTKEALTAPDKTFVENLPEFESRIMKERIIKKFSLADSEDSDLSMIHSLSDQELDFKFYIVITQIKINYIRSSGIEKLSSPDHFLAKFISSEDPVTISVLEAISKLGTGAMRVIQASSELLESYAADASQQVVVEPVATPEQQEQVDALAGLEETQENDALLGDGAIVCAVQ